MRNALNMRIGLVLMVAAAVWAAARGSGMPQACEASAPADQAGRWLVAPFEADITIPLGHPTMGGARAPARRIVDPLWAKGLVLWAADEQGRKSAAFLPVVLAALDWCQCNNDSYQRWREVLAQAAGTVPARVIVHTVHQHDAPICDLRAQEWLDRHGLKTAHCDPDFHEKAVQRVAAALRAAMGQPRRVTHIGFGQARVEKIASNRRIVEPDGRIHWGRGSASGEAYGQYPEGEIDPWLKMLSLWNGEQAVVAWSCYAVHPMSYYGQGEVSADFVGLARERWQREHPRTFHIYLTGCCGDVTAGKYNNGARENRPVLAQRLYEGMEAAWKATRRQPLQRIEFRCASLYLPVRQGGAFDRDTQLQILADAKAERWTRIQAAMGLSWRQRCAAAVPIDIPCVDVNSGQILFALLPAEVFVGYQLAAQQMRPDAFVMVAGFGDGAPGYIPTDACWDQGYNDSYCWVAPRTEGLIRQALGQALNVRGVIPGVKPPVDPAIAALRQEAILRELHPDFCWFHPRAAVVPRPPSAKDALGRPLPPRILLTLQKHLRISDYYSGLHVMWSDDLGVTWTSPKPVPELDWVRQSDGTIMAVADVTPGWHARSGKVLAIGAQVYYNAKGQQVADRPRFSQTAYAVYDPATDRWSPWQILELPDERRFDLARNGCGQWVVEDDGRLLIPIYFSDKQQGPYRVTVLECRFDGRRLTYTRHGDVLELAEVRGLSEPSLVRFRDRYYLTLRNDLKGYVTVSRDGLTWEAIRPWKFDDGTDLGSYNTQQHWVVGPNGLYLSYTRRGANNDHIIRHRAPLFLARVDTDKLVVVRQTEQVLIPERGVMLGNFGAVTIDGRQSWVTDAEFVFDKKHPRGADGTVWLARIVWNRPCGD